MQIASAVNSVRKLLKYTEKTIFGLVDTCDSFVALNSAIRYFPIWNTVSVAICAASFAIGFVDWMIALGCG